MKVEINDKGVMIVKAEKPSDRQKLLDWIELNNNALCNYAITVDCDYPKAE